ncbi:hypothetical protein BDZ91DRAFT_713996 [Kalaharituber pfeilii]|nr:hypothetical protein BDZ91DRAFT_713996 [Kalaharituber pfeilii]
MSTFRGVVAEFPDIRIDYFRPRPDARPPLACFLSHVHSDHLQGLEGFYGGPFIYCSEATKELLIRLERRAHRINFAKKLVEAHDFTYADKRPKLKTLPLGTPTMIELQHGRSVRVTLFDANHCSGAVMFLIEDTRHSILYTGDIRAEPWWVESIARHPALIPYATGIKRLSRIYLDTSYASREVLYQDLPTKTEGIRQLLETVSKYPKDTIFHFNAWTFGYEDVWVALAATFDTKIHVDKYQHRLFRSIRDIGASEQGPYLNGFIFGNSKVEGRLTNNPEIRFHSCDRKLDCIGLRGKKVVYIIPVVNKIGDVELQEVGLGQGDLESHSELSLANDNLKLLLGILGSQVSSKVQELLVWASHSRGEALSLDGDVDEKITFTLLSEVLTKIAETKQSQKHEPSFNEAEIKRQWDSKIEEHIVGENGEFLPTRISFPYSRHSSYNELRHLVGKFRPIDVYPCVVDEQNWSEASSIQTLFGELCTGDCFAHDNEMQLQRQLLRESEKRDNAETKNTLVLSNESSQLSDEETQRSESDNELNERKWFQQLNPPESLDTRWHSIQTTPLVKGKLKLKREPSNNDIEGIGTEIPVAKRVKGAGTYKEVIIDQTVGQQRNMDVQNSVSAYRNSVDEHIGTVNLEGEWAEIQLTSKSSTPSTDLEGNIRASLACDRADSTHPKSLERISEVNSQRKHPSSSVTDLVCQNAIPHQALQPEIVGSQNRRLSKQSSSSVAMSFLYTLNPKRTFRKNPIGHLPLYLPASVKSEEDFDIKRFQEGALAALGFGGQSWWNIKLQSTRTEWRYREEEEL